MPGPQPSPPPAPAATNSTTGSSWLLLPVFSATAIEVLALHAVATGRLGIEGLLLCHGGVVVLLGVWLHQLKRAHRDIVMPLLAAVAVTAAGPAGGIAALFMQVLGRRTGDDPELLRDWYGRIAMATETDETTRLAEKITTGRTVALTGRAPASFDTVIGHGALADRQTALGVIARNFHPDYLPVLMQALKSPEPVIRVQAAAVATRIRGDLRKLVDRLALGSPGSDTTSPEEACRQLDLAVASGLLDEGDRIRAKAVSERLRSQPGDAARPALRPVPLLEREAVELSLLRERRYAELRVSRRIAAVMTSRLVRVRRIKAAPVAREAA